LDEQVVASPRVQEVVLQGHRHPSERADRLAGGDGPVDGGSPFPGFVAEKR